MNKGLEEIDALQMEKLILHAQVLESQLAHVRLQVQMRLAEYERRYETEGWTLDLPSRIWTEQQ